MEINKSRVAELVVRIQEGDNTAFNELFELTNERAYFVALEFTKNNHDAEDILQESYIKALSKIKELDKPDSFLSWFNQIVANKSKDFLKKKKPTLFESDENEAFEVIPDEDIEFCPESSVDQSELQKTVLEVLDELKEEKRACIMMMYFQELSVGEIAQSLEIPEGTVKTRLFSARKDLKEMFAKRGITALYSAVPIGVVVWAMCQTSAQVKKAFAASAAYAKVASGVMAATTGAAAAVTGGTAAVATETSAIVGTGAAGGGATAASAGIAATGTGIVAKVTALTVAQKVIAGVSLAAVVAGSAAGIATVADSKPSEESDLSSTMLYTEEYTTAPAFEETVPVGLVFESTDNSGTTIFLQSDRTSNENNSEHLLHGEVTTAKVQITAVTKNDSAGPQTKASAKETTTVKRTTTTKKVTTTKKETTTQKVVTTKETKETTYANTRPLNNGEITSKETTVAPAKIIIKVLDLDNTVVDTLSFSVLPGTQMSNDYLWDLVESKGYDISGVYGSSKGSTAESGQTYSFEAEIFDA